MMKFYMTPGSCSTGIHILLEECGLIFEAHIVDLLRGHNRSAEYLAMNPRGTIPTLVLDDGQVLGDWVEIALWLADNHPRRKLLPQGNKARLRALSYLNLAVESIHGDGFTRIFTTDQYSADGVSPSAIHAEGEAIVSEGFEEFEQALSDTTWLFDDFSIADAALFYVEFWADRIKLPLPDPCQRHYRACLERPAVRQVLMEEGYGALFATG